MPPKKPAPGERKPRVVVPVEALPAAMRRQLEDVVRDIYAGLGHGAKRFHARMKKGGPAAERLKGPILPPDPPDVTRIRDREERRAMLDQYEAELKGWQFAQQLRDSDARILAAESVELKNAADTLLKLGASFAGLLEGTGASGGDAIQLDAEAELLANMRAKSKKPNPE